MNTLLDVTTADLRARFDADSRCTACEGTGRRGSGKCSRCEGSGAAHFGPRIRFNWGYHDARAEAGRGRARQLAPFGPGDERTVSPECGCEGAFWYAYGYAAGLRSEADDTESTAAWVDFVSVAVPAAVSEVA